MVVAPRGADVEVRDQPVLPSAFGLPNNARTRLLVDHDARLRTTYVGPGRGETCKKIRRGLPCPDGSTDSTTRTRCGRRIASRWSGAASWNWSSPRRPGRGRARTRGGAGGAGPRGAAGGAA